HVALTLRAFNQIAIVAIDALGDGEIEQTIDVASDPYGIAASEGAILVTSGWGHALTIVDREDYRTRAVIDLPREPRGIAITRDGKRAFIGHAVGNAVTRVDLDGGGEGEAPRVTVLAVLGARYRNAVERETGAGTLHPTSSLAFAPAL